MPIPNRADPIKVARKASAMVSKYLLYRHPLKDMKLVYR